MKIELRKGSEQDQEILLLNGVPYDNLPFLSPESKINEQELPKYRAELCLNDNKEITSLKDVVEWEPHMLMH